MLQHYERNLFNEEIKKQYINKKESEVILPNNYLLIQFSKSSKMEYELNKDISNFSTNEIIEYYKIINISFGSLVVLNSQLSLYTQWCLQQNLVADNQNHYLEISKDIINACTNNTLKDLKVINKNTIYDLINDNLNPKDNFALLGLFEGLNGKDFCELSKLRISDINGNELTLCTGRKINVSDKLINIINECVDEYYYYSITGTQSKIIQLVDSGYIIKNYHNVDNNANDYRMGRRIYHGIQRSFSYLGIPYMNANDLINSGKINMINERAKFYEISGVEYVNSIHIKEVEEQYNFKLVRSVFLNRYEKFLI